MNISTALDIAESGKIPGEGGLALSILAAAVRYLRLDLNEANADCSRMSNLSYSEGVRDARHASSGDR